MHTKGIRGQRPYIRLIIICWFAICALLQARTFTNDGETVEGEIDRVKGSGPNMKVYIRKSNGKVVNGRYRYFIASDKAYIDRWIAENQDQIEESSREDRPGRDDSAVPDVQTEDDSIFTETNVDRSSIKPKKTLKEEIVGFINSVMSGSLGFFPLLMVMFIMYIISVAVGSAILGAVMCIVTKPFRDLRPLGFGDYFGGWVCCFLMDIPFSLVGGLLSSYLGCFGLIIALGVRVGYFIWILNYWAEKMKCGKFIAFVIIFCTSLVGTVVAALLVVPIMIILGLLLETSQLW